MGQKLDAEEYWLTSCRGDHEKQPLCTPERARALLPTLLDVVDEMDEADREEAEDKRQLEIERRHT